jgi:hypothetical protein
MPSLDQPPRDKLQKKMLIAERALRDLAAWQAAVEERATARPALSR